MEAGISSRLFVPLSSVNLATGCNRLLQNFCTCLTNHTSLSIKYLLNVRYLCISASYIELYEHAILDYSRAVIFGATDDGLDVTRCELPPKERYLIEQVP